MCNNSYCRAQDEIGQLERQVSNLESANLDLERKVNELQSTIWQLQRNLEAVSSEVRELVATHV
jgi:peptidoglycan hydrolase CwlO-like protein